MNAEPCPLTPLDGKREESGTKPDTISEKSRLSYGDGRCGAAGAVVSKSELTSQLKTMPLSTSRRLDDFYTTLTNQSKGSYYDRCLAATEYLKVPRSVAVMNNARLFSAMNFGDSLSEQLRA